MLRLGLKFVFEIYGAKKASLGVFENNLPAYYCYKAVGFNDTVLDKTETYCVPGEEWKCRELIMEKFDFHYKNQKSKCGQGIEKICEKTA